MLAIFLDQETTGLDPTRHHVLELAFKIIDVFTGALVMEYQCIVKHPPSVWDARDPTSMLINGFEWDQIVNYGKELFVIREEILKAFATAGIQRGKAVFVCQNPAFDKGFFAQLIDVYTQEKLNWPYHWLDFASMYWALMMQDPHLHPFDQINLSKDEIAKRFNLPSESKPHKAMNGVDHLILCYKNVVGLVKEGSQT